jgi:hypothetical protein
MCVQNRRATRDHPRPTAYESIRARLREEKGRFTPSGYVSRIFNRISRN